MATVNYQLKVDTPRVKVILWETLTETNDVGQPFVFSGWYPDKCIQLLGSFGTGGHLTMQGSNDPALAAYAALNDIADSPIDLTAVGFEQILECPYAIRPKVTAGTSVDLDVWLIVRKL